MKWDNTIPLESLWEQYRRITKPDSPIILFGQGLFSARLMLSQSKMWRYNLVWQKDRVTGHLNANRMPLRQHEDILVFYKKQPVYHPQMSYKPGQKNHPRGMFKRMTNRCYGAMKPTPSRISDWKYPTSVIYMPKEFRTGMFYHPTQKPVALIEYLIRTYTDEGDVVLDNCIGSGTTAVAAIRSGRHYIGFETEQAYCEIAERRIREELERGEIREKRQGKKNKINKSMTWTKRNRNGIFLAAGLLGTPNVQAQRTYEEMEQLTVNEQVTTVITASEPVRFVDISTDKVVGDQPIDNIVRLKPKEGGHEDGEVLAIVTIVTERYRTQYALLYTTRVREAVTDKEIQLQERNAYHNPAVSMSTVEMTRFARRIWNSPAKIRNVATKAHRMTMRLNNIYSVGEYFFIDFSIENRTNIRFDIDEIRVKLADKKLAKATNAQVIELTPALVLEAGKTFRHGYRNVVVVRKMTFPNDKVLTIEMTEKQISGRNISLNIDYEDVLSADSFSASLLEEE